MKTTILAFATLILASTASFAGTVPSTFDANCNVNWVNGGCGDISVKGSLQITNGRACNPKDGDTNECKSCHEGRNS